MTLVHTNWVIETAQSNTLNSVPSPRSRIDANRCDHYLPRCQVLAVHGGLVSGFHLDSQDRVRYGFLTMSFGFTYCRPSSILLWNAGTSVIGN